jgi:hypothetical protein
MAIKKKTAKKGKIVAKRVKTVKFSKRPAAKVTKRAASKKVVKKSVIKSKKPAAKSVAANAKKTAPKKVKKASFIQRILTAEGWNRLMMRKRKSAKAK